MLQIQKWKLTVETVSLKPKKKQKKKRILDFKSTSIKRYQLLMHSFFQSRLFPDLIKKPPSKRFHLIMLKYFFVIKFNRSLNVNWIIHAFLLWIQTISMCLSCLLARPFSVSSIFQFWVKKLLLKLSSLCWNTFFIVERNRLLEPVK